jgi:hypothetical protein
MGIVDRVKRIFGRGEDDAEDGADEAGGDAEEQAESYDRVRGDIERDRNKAYERLTDVDGGRYG